MEAMKGVMGGEVKEYCISVLEAYHRLCISFALLLKGFRLSLAQSSPSASSLAVSSFLGLLQLQEQEIRTLLLLLCFFL